MRSEWWCVNLYDTIMKKIDLTDDEISLLQELLFYRLESCISLGEELTVKGLLDKIV